MEPAAPAEPRPAVAGDAILLILTSRAERYAFGQSGEPLPDGDAERARADLGDAINTAWQYLRPGVPEKVGPTCDPTPAGWIPPAAADVPPAAYKVALDGAAALDSYARTPYGCNLIGHAVAALHTRNWLVREHPDDTDDFTGDQWTAAALRRELLVARYDARHYLAHVERLGAWLLQHGPREIVWNKGSAPHEIREPGLAAVELAIRCLDHARLDGQKLATGLLELCPEEGDPVADSDPRAGESVVDAVLRRLAEATHDAARYRADHDGACHTIARMHAAAVGESGCAPRRGVVEDVADIRTRMLAAEEALSRHAERVRADHDEPTDPVDVTEFGQFRARAISTRPPGEADLGHSRQRDRIAKYLAAAGLNFGVDEAIDLTSPGVVVSMRRIASSHPAVKYDAYDRPENRAAVIVAAVLADLVPVPSTTITPRAYLGGPLPADEALLDEHADRAPGGSGG